MTNPENNKTSSYNWERLHSLVTNQIHFAVSILAVRLDDAHRLEVEADLCDLFGYTTGSQGAKEVSQKKREQAHETRKFAYNASATWVAIALPVVFAYWVVSEGVITDAIKAIGYAIRNVVSSIWNGFSSVVMAIRNKIFGPAVAIPVAEVAPELATESSTPAASVVKPVDSNVEQPLEPGAEVVSLAAPSKPDTQPHTPTRPSAPPLTYFGMHQANQSSPFGVGSPVKPPVSARYGSGYDNICP